MTEKPWLSKLVPFVRNDIEWEAYEQLLDFHIGMHQRKLEGSTDMPDIYRAQGAIGVLKQMKQLKEEINVKK